MVTSSLGLQSWSYWAGTQPLRDTCKLCNCCRHMYLCLQVLSRVSKLLADMHEAGLVHRNVKPSNILWLQREAAWKLIDFARVARAGQRAASSVTLTYAAPEIVDAVQLQAREIVVDPAHDAWALGVIAMELFTGMPPFDIIALGHSRVCEQATALSTIPVCCNHFQSCMLSELNCCHCLGAHVRCGRVGRGNGGRPPAQ